MNKTQDYFSNLMGRMDRCISELMQLSTDINSVDPPDLYTLSMRESEWTSALKVLDSRVRRRLIELQEAKKNARN